MPISSPKLTKRRKGKRPNNPRGLRLAIDVFAGCGGMTCGLKDAGFKVAAAIEIDAKAADTYAANHPDTLLVRRDVRKVSGRSLLNQLGLKAGQLDLLAGCPPCQSFSRIRKLNRQKAAKDQRNELVLDFLRLARTLRPKAIMLENVPGLKKHYRFEYFVQALRRLGYESKYATLDAGEYGVPQRRARLIYVGCLNREPEFGTPSLRKITVRDAIGSLPKPGRGDDKLHNLPEKRSSTVLDRIRAISKNGGSRSELPRHLQLECHQRSDGFGDVYGRMSWDLSAPTITGGCHNPSKGRFLHPTQHRAITMREAALLQGFPRNYKFDVHHGKESIALMIGNALPPPFISCHAIALRRTLEHPT